MQTVGLCPTPHKLFEKSLIKNFTKVGFVLPHALTFALPKPRVRWPRQDDGAASGSRAKFVRVKPDKHRPVTADGVEAALFFVWRKQKLLIVRPWSLLHYSLFIIHHSLFITSFCVAVFL
jgi:hypothetical protein